ncbi:phosphotransferase enzyme family protein [Paragemmobacter ruber]|uniref:Phosphotransferase n=1 Tax=Paragemmobacter ruber TaxID=1985673 RepID=A0ABW9Y9C5_9RHOB|nr:phosphotransferase [Rhodobacter ruber]NBE09196.1 phosphotransferase [Rhodobacter ruber]
MATMTEAEARAAAALWQGRVSRLIVARENAVYEMALPEGTCAALRLHRTGYQDAAAIRSELWWCAELAALGLPVPAPLPLPDGEHLATLATGRHASAVRWLDGEAIGAAGRPLAHSTPAQIDLHVRLGQLLRRLHETSDRLTLPPGFSRPRWDGDGLMGEAPLWGRFWEHPAASYERSSALLAARVLLRSAIDRHAKAGGDFGLIHADVLRENILRIGPDLALIDFDDSGFGFRLYDLGTVLSQNQYEPARDDLRDALMAGYGTQDVEMVELFTLARVLASVGWTMPRLAPDDPIHRSHLARADMVIRRVLG